jgi:hypothetical protein
MGRRNVAVLPDTLADLDQLTEELADLPPERLHLRPHRMRKRVSRSRVADDVIERGIKVMREEYGLSRAGVWGQCSGCLFWGLPYARAECYCAREGAPYGDEQTAPDQGCNLFEEREP